MCSEMDRLVYEGVEQAVLQQAKESALNFYRMGFPVEQIAAGINVDIELVKQWISENT